MLTHRVPSGKIVEWLRGAARTAMSRRDIWFVECDARKVPFIAECANCLVPTNQGLRESSQRHSGGAIVPYCGECLARVARERVLRLAWRLSSMLLGLVASLFIPMLAWLPKVSAVILAAVIVCLPWFAYGIWRAFRRKRSVVDSRAVIELEGGLGCFNEHWGRKLAQLLGTTPVLRRVNPHSVAEWSYGGVVVAVLLTPWLYDAFHPQLRLLNLTEDTLVISADHHVLAKLEPTSTENPRAGLLIRVASGPRQLTARRADGTLVETVSASLLAGRTHLFAPSRPPNTCFWLEQTQVGGSSNREFKHELPDNQSNFWVIPKDVDSWFGRVLDSGPAFGTGGVVTSLRQGFCSRAGE